MSSTTTRPPRTPGALVADAVADLQDASARLAQLAADGAFAEVPDIANTVLLCVRHHHAVHEGGWTITPTDGIDPHTTGCWTFTPPRTRP